MKTRIVRSYQDIALIEVSDFDSAKIINRAFSVRVASDQKALRQFRDLNAARNYFADLVLRRINSITLAMPNR